MLLKDEFGVGKSDLAEKSRSEFEEEGETKLGLGFCGSDDEMESGNESLCVFHSEDFDYSGENGVSEHSKGEFDSGFSEYPEEEIVSNEGERSDGFFDGFDGDDEEGSLFPCPFCYVDIEVHLLCYHFEEEHRFDVGNTVCPLCAENLDRNMTGHFVVHHGSSLKVMRKSHITEANGSTMLGNDMSLFLGYFENNRNMSVPDNLTQDMSYPKNNQQDICSHDNATVASDSKRSDPAMEEIHEEEIKEQRLRASFIQELLFSTIL